MPVHEIRRRLGPVRRARPHGFRCLCVQLPGRDQAGRGHHQEGGSGQGEPRDAAAHRRSQEAPDRGQGPPRERQDEARPRRRGPQGQDRRSPTPKRPSSSRPHSAPLGGRRQRFAGHAVFITGASSGIGAALAREFAREGADVALAARRLDRLEALAAEIGKLGRRAVVIPCDVTRDGDLERAAEPTRAALGKLDVVVANAGFGVSGRAGAPGPRRLPPPARDQRLRRSPDDLRDPRRPQADAAAVWS